MPISSPRSSLAVAFGLCLLLPAPVVAQAPSPGPSPQDGAMLVDGAPADLPELEGLAWYRSIDLTGPEIEATQGPEEVAAWAAMLEAAASTFDQFGYTYHAAFDPERLPELGGVATVHVEGAQEEALRDAVVADIVAQVVAAGSEAPEPEAATVGGKDVIVVDLPVAMGFEQAMIHAVGDVAYVVLMPESLAERVLEQLP